MGWINVGFAGGYNACVDFPFSLFYKELLEAIPDAKVLLTVRDHGDTWNKSVYDTIHGIERNRGLFFATGDFLYVVPDTWCPRLHLGQFPSRQHGGQVQGHRFV